MRPTTVCANCGEIVTADARFCLFCGSPQSAADAAPSATRREARPPANDLLERLQRATAGDYEVRGELGRGGMATVFLGYDLLLGRRVAIKVMLPELSASEAMRPRFREEARTAARLDHPNIVTIHAVREVDDLLFLIMKYVEGRTVADALSAGTVFDITVAQLVLSQIARALAYAHEEGVVHRDVKPGNIMLDIRGSAVVTDFGIAKAVASPSLTQTGTAIGTPAYMSPEQCLGRPATAAADQYSLGVVAYEMLGGRVPFTGSTLEIQWAHAKEPPPPLERSDCPSALAAAVIRMLEKDPAKRWPSLHEVAAAFASGLTVHDEAIARTRLAELVRAGVRRSTHESATPVSPIPVARRGPPAPLAPRRPPLAAATFTVTDPVLEVGESLTLEAAITGADGATVGMSANVRWSSSDPTVATVDGAGTVRAVAPGRVQLTASTQDATSSVTLTVVPVRLSRITIVPPPPPVHVGDQVRLSATAYDRRGGTRPATMHWSTRDGHVGAVTDDGVFTARAPGSAVVEAEAGGVRASATITVAGVSTPPPGFRVPRLPEPVGAAAAADDEGELTELTATPSPVASVTISPPPTTRAAGDSFRLRATPTDARGAVLSRWVGWGSSDERVASVAPGGVVTINGAGQAVITATVDGVEGSVTILVPEAAPHTPREPAPPRRRGMLVAAASVPVLAAAIFALVNSRTITSPLPAPADSVAGPPPPSEPPAGGAAAASVASVASVAISPAPSPIVAGDSFALNASVRDGQGQVVGARQVRWRSRNPAVATVDSASGLVVTRGPGSVVIEADADGVGDSVALDVARRSGGPAGGSSPARIVIAKPPQLGLGDSVRLVASSSRDSAGGRALAGVRWASNEPTIVAVDPERGVARALSVGSAIVTAQAGPVRGTVVVTVRPGDVASLIIAPPRPMRVGDEQEIRLTVTDHRDEVLYGREARWTSADPSIAEVDASNGIATAISPGTTTLTTVVGGVRGSVRVTVLDGDRVASPDSGEGEGAPRSGDDARPPPSYGDEPTPAEANAAGAKASEPKAGEPPPEVVAPLQAGVEAGFAHFANIEYKAAADTLRAVEAQLRDLAREYPRSKQVAALRLTVTRYQLTNQRMCEQAGAAARQSGTEPPACQ
jgi:serine/threonine-protein kinase